jgi:hypothetical protein
MAELTIKKTISSPIDETWERVYKRLCPIKNSLWDNIWEVVWDSVAAEIYDRVHAELCFVHRH